MLIICIVLNHLLSLPDLGVKVYYRTYILLYKAIIGIEFNYISIVMTLLNFICRNVGFLKYYEVKQIPNFILASPVLMLTFLGLWKYFTYDIKKLYSLGTRNQKSKIIHLYFSPSISLFMFHWLLLGLISVFFIHIQVSTRFIFSQCISIYWFLAHIMINHKKFKYIIVFYMFIYNVLGIILFPTFYPWT